MTSSTTSTREWNSAIYHSVSEPQVGWGRQVLARLTLRGDEIVLDAGCGTGRLTVELAERLPRGRVVGVDVSENMLRTAQEYLRTVPETPARIQLLKADVLALPFPAMFDGIFSTATFHWVLDHDKLFAELFRVLQPGGWLCAQCGGGPNLAKSRAGIAPLMARPEYAPYFSGFVEPWLYSDAAEAAERLTRAGFTDVRTSIEAAPVAFDDAESYRRFVGNVIFRPHLARLTDAAVRERFLEDVTRVGADTDPRFHLDYWRLNLWGRKPT